MEKSKGKFYFYCLFITICACYIYMINSGIRNNFGIMVQSIIENSGVSFVSISFILAVNQLSFGITQPIFGVIADKKGNRFALLCGIFSTAFSLMLMPYCKSMSSLFIVLGILLPSGIGALAFGIIMGTLTPQIPQQYKSIVNGIVNASSGIGNTMLTPIINAAIVAGGLAFCTKTLSVFALIMLPACIIFCAKENKKSNQTIGKQNIKTSELFQISFKNRDYIFIVIGFFTCGFHMALITNHLPTQIISYGFTNTDTSNMFSIYGVATMVGAFITGILGSKLKMKNILGTLYSSRTVMTILFFVLPKTSIIIALYIFLLGFTGAATVSPVSGICGKIFGVRGMSILFSFAFLVHQIGGFFSAWLDGVCFDVMGSYTLIWFVDIVLCAIAGIVSYMITEKAVIS